MFQNCLEQAVKLYAHTDVILICDKKGYIEYVSFQDGSFFSTIDVVGMHILELYPELTNETSTIMQVIQSRQPRYDDRQILHYKEQVLDVVTSTLPILKNDVLIGVIAVSVYTDMLPKEKTPIKKNRLYTLGDIITQDAEMLLLKEKCAQIANLDSNVLLYGETGTGKELFAQSLHTESHRVKERFISQNCAAIPASLLEGLLFGSEKGSFTGAETRKGLFELADGGTLFLDEINSMDLMMQAKILKIIEEQKVRRIGGNKDIPFHVRIVCAMNESPEAVLRQQKIRSDLYYRISVIRMDIPPLRDRKGDIPYLAEYFIRYFNQKMGKNIEGISDLVRMNFESHSWTGNVRELRNTIESAFAMENGSVIGIHSLQYFKIKTPDGNELLDTNDTAPQSLADALYQYEKTLLLKSIKSTKNFADAARYLGISRQSLHYKLDKFRIDTNKL